MENPNHSDFGKLRTMLIQSHMHDLKETTQDLHYENFRAKTISLSQSASRERSKLKRDSSADSPQDLLLQKEAEVSQPHLKRKLWRTIILKVRNYFVYCFL